MLHLRDLKLPEGVRIPGFVAHTDSDLPVVHLHVLHAVEEPVAEVAAAATEAAAAPAAGVEKAGEKPKTDKK
jgi:hypothetical protein